MTSAFDETNQRDDPEKGIHRARVHFGNYRPTKVIREKQRSTSKTFQRKVGVAQKENTATHD